MLEFSYSDTGFIEKEELEENIRLNSGKLEECIHGHEEYRNSLGWLDVDKWAGDKWIDYARETAEKIRKMADVFVIIGVGGSNNSARAVIEAMDYENGMKMVYAGNTLSPHELRKVLGELEGHDVVIDCIAKNFETLEPGASFRFLRKFLVGKYGKEGAKERIYTCGTPGSHLDELSRIEGWTFFPFPEDIGGRYTALSPVHMVPLAVAGADIEALAKGARDMRDHLRVAKGFDNEALCYATIRDILFRKGKHIGILSSFEPRLRYFFLWWKQLFAESHGKDEKGILPISAEYSEELHSLGQYFQDGIPAHFETLIDVKDPEASLVLENDGVDDRFDYLDGMDFRDINRASLEATMKAHSKVMQTMRITIDRIDEYHFGLLFYFFEFTCYLSGTIMGVNPFNQPGVEAYKKWMFDILGKDR